MIVLDTNVISEAMKLNPDSKAMAWLNSQVVESLYLSSVTMAELLFGVRALPAGKRKDQLARSLDRIFALFGDRVLPFDSDAARHFAELAAIARANGRGFPTEDGYIAAIAVARGFIVASRNMSPFMAANLTIINPWES
jgi:predicted nucleic acid-binding protein